jgi:hypothetical protein
MSEQATVRSSPRPLVRLIFGTGEQTAGLVYGTVVVMATIAAAYATEKDPWRLAVLVSLTVLVLWIAHVYAHGLSLTINRRRRLVRGDLRLVAERELGIILAAVPPVAALLLGALELVREKNAVWLALALGLVTLGGEGVRYARLEHLRFGGALLVVAANLALGLLVVLLKVLLAH